MRLLIKLRTCSAGLLEDKKICRMVNDERCVVCHSRVGKKRFILVGCGELERYRQVLLDDVCRIVWAREWLDEFWRLDEKEKVALLLGKGVEGVCKQSDGGSGRVHSVLVG